MSSWAAVVGWNSRKGRETKEKKKDTRSEVPRFTSSDEAETRTFRIHYFLDIIFGTLSANLPLAKMLLDFATFCLCLFGNQ